MDLNALLRRAVELGASDIHLKVGQPPVLRRDGELGPLEESAPLGDARSRGRARSVVGKRSPERLAALRRDAATSTSPTGRGPAALPRQRLPPARRRSPSPSASSPRTCPTFEQLGLPPGVERLAEEHRGLVLVTGATGSGQDDDARGDDRPHQPDAAAAHRHDRGPDRDPASRTASCIVNQREVGLDTESFHAGAAARAAPGPRRDPDRRAARRRDGADRAAGRRVGPPRLLDAAHDRRRRDDRPHDRVLPARQAAADPLGARRRPARRRQPAPAPARAAAAASRPSR